MMNVPRRILMNTALSVKSLDKRKTPSKRRLDKRKAPSKRNLDKRKATSEQS